MLYLKGSYLSSKFIVHCVVVFFYFGTTMKGYTTDGKSCIESHGE